MNHYHLIGVQTEAFRISTQKTFYVDSGEVRIPVLPQGPKDRLPYPCCISHFLQGKVLDSLFAFKYFPGDSNVSPNSI